MTGDSNVIQLVIPRQDDRKLSGRADAANDVRRRFRDGGRAQRETFTHLARQTFVLVEELKATFGERSGKMKIAFGDLLKQKKRFILAENAEIGTLCQNPGNWDQVLRGLAGALGRNPDQLLLEVMRGSPLLPGQQAPGYRREQWLSSLQDLMVQMAERVTATIDYAPIATYLADSGLRVDEGRLELCETQDGSIGVDEFGLYHPFVLSGMPHVLGLNFRTRIEQSYGCVAVDLPVVLAKAGLDNSIAKGESSAVLRAGTRTGLALALDAGGLPAIALVEWEIFELVFAQGDANEWAVPIYLSYADLEIDGDYSSVPPPNSIRFHFTGSPGFDAAAAAHIVFPEVWADGPHSQIWDPGGYVSTVEDYPTDAPGRTVGAVIERNLLYASPGHKAERLDTLLLKQLEHFQELVSTHRHATTAPISSAKLALLTEWSAATRAQSKTLEQ